jgi:hypothetical protein
MASHLSANAADGISRNNHGELWKCCASPADANAAGGALRGRQATELGAAS